MTNFTNIRYEYFQKNIGKMNFIKVEIRDKKFGIIDVRMFYKHGNKYQAIEQFDLPKKIVDELMNNDGYSQDLSIADVYNLDKYLVDKIDEIKDLNDIDNRISVVLKHYFSVIRDDKMFLIKPFNTNQFGLIKETAINTQLIPYIMCDLIEVNPKYNNNLFYFDGNIFAQISEVRDFIILSIIHVDEKNGQCNLNTIFKLKKNKMNWDISMDIKMDGIEEIVQDEINKFIKRLES